MNKNYIQIASCSIPIDEYKFTFDDVELLKLMTTCKTYEEFRMQCDLKNIECIITRAEFENAYLSRHYEESDDLTQLPF